MILLLPKIIDGLNDGAERELTPEEQASVTSVKFTGTHYVYYQGDEPAHVISLEQLKSITREKVDEETSSNIVAGFTYAGLTFSMSLEAQVNWTNFPFFPEAKFPLSIMSKDDEELLLEFSNKNLFYGTALTHKSSCLEAGNIKKKAVNACQTEADLLTLIESWSNTQMRRGRSASADFTPVIEAIKNSASEVPVIAEAAGQSVWQKFMNYIKSLFK